MNQRNFDFYIPRWEQLPDIELYLDQVVNYLQTRLEAFHLEKSEKLITKMMVNNYVKQGALPPPIKKKYDRSHLAYLFVICVLKQVYSINDIKVMMRLGLGVAPIELSYNEFCSVLEESIECIFSNKIYIDDEPLGKARHLLKCATQSYANKLYVQSTFLNKYSNDVSNYFQSSFFTARFLSKNLSL
jgi:DNA-binding transcriptional MerR regulator